MDTIHSRQMFILFCLSIKIKFYYDQCPKMLRNVRRRLTTKRPQTLTVYAYRLDNGPHSTLVGQNYCEQENCFLFWLLDSFRAFSLFSLSLSHFVGQFRSFSKLYLTVLSFSGEFHVLCLPCVYIFATLSLINPLPAKRSEEKLICNDQQ